MYINKSINVSMYLSSIALCPSNIYTICFLVPFSLEEDTVSSRAPGIKLGRFQVTFLSRDDMSWVCGSVDIITVALILAEKDYKKLSISSIFLTGRV